MWEEQDMRALLYDDTFPRLVKDWRNNPGKWASRLVFLLGPWVCLWMVEILNENDVFEDLAAWQVLMNMVFYYSIFIALRLLLGRNRRAAALGTVLCFLLWHSISMQVWNKVPSWKKWQVLSRMIF